MQLLPVTTVLKATGGEQPSEDLLVTEEPLEIRLGFGPLDARKEERVAVTMRTPGNDHSLALGFLFTEGIIPTAKVVLRIEHCQQVKPEERGNVIRIELHPEFELGEKSWKRNFYTTSSCGVCGKSSIESVQVSCAPVDSKMILPKEKLLFSLPNRMRSKQVLFEHTGGIHAAALFSAKGELVALHEDIGRHNAVDKIIGETLRNGAGFSDRILVLSGRAGFELVQKAAVAGIPVVLSVGAPSSLAVSLAQERNIVLFGFVREGRGNRYTNIDTNG